MHINIKNFTTKLAIITIAFFSLTACNDDFSDVGSSIVDDNNFEALQYDNAALEAHSVKIKRVQSNELSSYALGVYNDAKYGQTTASVLTQLQLSDVDPSFGVNPVLDSVVLVVPYYSTIASQTYYDKTYELDSVFGDSPIKLSIYRSDYYLRDNDPSNNYEAQAYYSDQADLFEQHMANTPIYANSSFKPSANEIVLVEPSEENEGEMDTTRLSPRLRIKLPVSKFKNWIIDKAGSTELLTNENFKNYFRGLYFKADAIGGEGVLSLLNFNADDAGITLYYRTEYETESGESSLNNATYELNFSGQTVNVFTTDYQQLPAQDQNLYVKGGQGSMAVIDLFTDEAQLDSLRQTDWLINEANLKFYVNQDALPAGYESPERVFIYDIANGLPLKDYYMDGGVKENDVLNSRTVHLGRLSTDENGNPYYKVRITNYVNDIINNDSTNTKLGLVISQNVNIDELTKVQVDGNDSISVVPRSEVIARDGTVLYGPEAPSVLALKLEIYYTKPN